MRRGRVATGGCSAIASAERKATQLRGHSVERLARAPGEQSADVVDSAHAHIGLMDEVSGRRLKLDQLLEPRRAHMHPLDDEEQCVRPLGPWHGVGLASARDYCEPEQHGPHPAHSWAPRRPTP
eukprot:scaffold157228_cov41-Tisochrysis_lutea.AAC.1